MRPWFEARRSGRLGRDGCCGRRRAGRKGGGGHQRSSIEPREAAWAAAPSPCPCGPAVPSRGAIPGRQRTRGVCVASWAAPLGRALAMVGPAALACGTPPSVQAPAQPADGASAARGEPLEAAAPVTAAAPEPGVAGAAGETAAAPQPGAPANNLIENGDFSAALEPWGAHATRSASGRPVQAERIDGALCVRLFGDESVVAGWPVAGSPQRVELAEGERYRLALRTAARGQLPVRCVAKLGHQLPPYTGAFVTELPLGADWTPFATEFVARRDDDRAGLALECDSPPGAGSALVCFDDVTLQR